MLDGWSGITVDARRAKAKRCKDAGSPDSWQRFGNNGTWLALAGGLSAGAVLFAAAALRGSAGDAPHVGGMAAIADAEP
jgi:hypothetical protein